MDKKVLAEKLYQAFARGTGASKIARFDPDAPAGAGWLHVAEIAIANLCDPRRCSHIDEAVKGATEGLKKNHAAELERLGEEHAAALEAAKVQIVATEDGGTEVRRGDEVLFAAPAVAEVSEDEEDTAEALLDVFADIDDALYEALLDDAHADALRLITLKAGLYGLR
jgi:hypothetical protein